MSINASKTCAAKSAAKIDTIFELHNTFTTLFIDIFSFLAWKSALNAILPKTPTGNRDWRQHDYRRLSIATGQKDGGHLDMDRQPTI